MVLETEQKALCAGILKKSWKKNSPMTRMKIHFSFHSDRASDINGTKDLFPVGPLTIIGGTISGHLSKSNIQVNGSLFTKGCNVVFQDTRGYTNSINNHKRNNGCQITNGSRKRKISALPSTKTSKMYLILPSFAEQYKADIKMIIARKSKTLQHCFFRKHV